MNPVLAPFHQRLTECVNVAEASAILEELRNSYKEYIEKSKEGEPKLSPITHILPSVEKFVNNVVSIIYSIHLVNSNHFAEARATLLPIISLESPEPEFERWRSLALRGIIYMLRAEGNIAVAYEYADRLLVAAQSSGNRSELAEANALVGSLYSRIDDFSDALEYYTKALELWEQYEADFAKILVTYSTIATLYARMGLNEPATQYLLKATTLVDNHPEKKSELALELELLYNNLGDLYLKLENFEQARYYLNACLEVHNIPGSTSSKSLIYHNLAVLERKAGNYNEAFALLDISQRERFLGDDGSVDAESVAVETWNLVERGNIYLQLKQFQSALTCLTEAAQQQPDWQNKQDLVVVLATAFAEAYKGLGDFEKALTYFKIYHDKSVQALNSAAEIRFQNMELARTAEQRMNALREKEAQTARENQLIREQNEQLTLLNNQILQQKELLEQKNAQLKYLNEQKNEFLSIAAHDLKNPLHSIKMIADIILTTGEISQQELHELVSDILKTAEQMFSLIIDLLDINRIEEGNYSLNLMPVEIVSALQATVTIYQEKARQKNITLQLDAKEKPLLFNGDETVFRQITENLISNAVKYSPMAKNVWVRCLSLNGYVVIEVQDEGPGFTEEDKQKMFQRFQRLSARPTVGEHSTGLGLSIVHKLVRLLNGTIECISEAGKGATFRITFPASDFVF